MLKWFEADPAIKIVINIIIIFTAHLSMFLHSAQYKLVRKSNVRKNNTNLNDFPENLPKSHGQSISLLL